MKKRLWVGFSVLTIAGCANNGTLPVPPRFTPLLIKAAPSALTTASATALSVSAKGHSGMLQSVGATIPLQFYNKFKSCPTSATSVSECSESAAVTNPSGCFADGAMIDGTVFGYSCSLDSFIYMTSDVAMGCGDATGKDIDLTKFFPFAASWGVPASIRVTSMEGEVSTALKYANFKLDDGSQGIFTQSNDQINLGHKTSSGEFFFIYFRTTDVGVSNINMTAVAGNTLTKRYEMYMVDQSSASTTRMKSNADYLYVQQWSTTNAKSAGNQNKVIADGEAAKCYALATLKEVAMTSCESAFGGTGMTSGANEALFILKAIDFGTDMVDKGASYFTPATTPAVAGASRGCL